jgi:hypothetical protein
MDREFMFRIINVNGKSEFDAVTKEEVKGRDIFVVFYDVNQE